MTRYVFDNVAAQAVDRMVCLETCYDPVTRQRLSEVGVEAGWRCLEIGAGGGSVAEWLAERVGESGRVLATDINTRLIRAFPSNVDVMVHDIVRDELPEAEFDLVHARLVLLHLPERVEALRRIMRALRPGGYLVLDEFDCTWLPVLAAPDEASAALFGKVVDGVHALLAEAGADLAWGRNAYGAMRRAGFVDLTVCGWSTAWPGGSLGARLHEANVGQVADRLLARGMATEQELDAFLALVADPGFTASSYLMLTTTGRRPGRQ